LHNKAKMIDIIYKCADELNRQLPEEGKLILEKSTAIIGVDSPLDSLGLIIFILSIEEHMTSLDINCNILDVLTQSNDPPFVTIEDMSLWLIDQSK
jgi:hypothetical protein